MQLVSALTAVCLLTAVLLFSPIHCYVEYSFYPIRDVFLVGEHVLFRFNLTNNYMTGLLFLTWGTPLDYIPGPILSLTQGGIPLRTFLCPVASRLPPSAPDFEFLPAGEGISVLYNVTGCYAVDTAGNYSANASAYISAKLISSVTADTSYDLASFSLLDLSVSDISFCVARSLSDACLLSSDTSADRLFNTTLVSSAQRLVSPFAQMGIICLIFSVLITLLY